MLLIRIISCFAAFTAPIEIEGENQEEEEMFLPEEIVFEDEDRDLNEEDLAVFEDENKDCSCQQSEP